MVEDDFGMQMIGCLLDDALLILADGGKQLIHRVGLLEIGAECILHAHQEMRALEHARRAQKLDDIALEVLITGTGEYFCR